MCDLLHLCNVLNASLEMFGMGSIVENHSIVILMFDMTFNIE